MKRLIRRIFGVRYSTHTMIKGNLSSGTRDGNKVDWRK